MTKTVEVITSVQRRRRWSRAEKERIVAAALEPETQGSYAANRVLTLPQIVADRLAYLPLYRLPAEVKLSSVIWEAD